MDEPTRNMLGFMIVPAALGFVTLAAIYRSRRKWPPVWRTCLAIGGPVVLGFAFFFCAQFLELPVAYTFTVMRMSGAKSASGVLASKLINDTSAHWYTDDYYADDCSYYENLTMMRLETAFNSSDYYFAYDSETREVVPMTDAAAARFPTLLPAGDKLVSLADLGDKNAVGRTVGDNVLKVPEKWFRKVTGTEKYRAAN